MNILIKSATIVDPGGPLHEKKRDILIRNGIIEKIAASISPESKQISELNLKNLHVSRGWFDSSVSFGEPGYEDRETLSGGLRMAAYSGYCDLVLNPSNSPLPDTSGDIRFLLDKTSDSACRIHPLGTLTKGAEGMVLAELYDMHNHGACGFSEDQKYLENSHLLQLALEYTRLFKGCVVTFPLENHLASRGVIHEGSVSARMGLKGIPSLAEELAVIRDLRIQEYTGGKLHLALISAEGSVKLLQEAKRKGRDISSAVSIHHLYFTDEDLLGFDNNLKLLPPLRSKKDRKALREAVLNRTIDMVTSDHRPLTLEEKEVEFNNSYYGSTGLETAYAVLQEIFGRDSAIELLTRGRDRFGIQDPYIAKGQPAALSLFNPDATFHHLVSNMLGKSKNSPYLGRKFKGRPYGIISNNRMMIRPDQTS